MRKTHHDKETEDTGMLPDPEAELPSMNIIPHSTLFYWWPVWLVGYILALLTYLEGTHVEIGTLNEMIHEDRGVGVVFILILLTVILFTSVTVRGMAAAAFIFAAMFVGVTLAWLGLWDDVTATLDRLSVHLNAGFFMVFSTGLLILWLVVFFIVDRMCYWRIRPGQLSEMRLIGDAERNYDTRGMLVEKHREDPFRHIILGLGSGDLHVATSGARTAELSMENVLFVDRKLKKLRKLISIQPDSLMEYETGREGHHHHH